MFIINKSFARNNAVDLDDTAKIKFSMRALNYYDDSETGLSPYADDGLFRAVKAFQKDNGLKIDGVIKPDGPTLEKIKENIKKKPEAQNAFEDFYKNYSDMREADTIGADKYFHCKANYQATKRGWDGFAVAGFVSNVREAVELITNPFKMGVAETAKDTIRDQKANMHGRNSARFGDFSSAEEACAIYRPEALSDKY